MRAATERAEKQTPLVAAEERCRWVRAPKVRKKKANANSGEILPVARENITQEPVAARSGQEGSNAVTDASVAPALEAAASAMPADVRLVQVSGDVGSQRSSRSTGTHQEGEDEVAVVAPGLCGQWFAAVAEALVLKAPAQAGDVCRAKMEVTIQKLDAENLVLHEELIVEKMHHARALLNSVRLQRDMKRAVKEKDGTVRLLAPGHAMFESSAMEEQLRKGVFTVTIKAGEQIGTLTASLEQVQKEAGV